MATGDAARELMLAVNSCLPPARAADRERLQHAVDALDGQALSHPVADLRAAAQRFLTGLADAGALRAALMRYVGDRVILARTAAPRGPLRLRRVGAGTSVAAIAAALERGS